MIISSTPAYLRPFALRLDISAFWARARTSATPKIHNYVVACKNAHGNMVAMHCWVSLHWLHKKYWHLTTRLKKFDHHNWCTVPNQLVLEQTRSHVLSVQGVRRVLSLLQQWISLFQETASIEEETSESPFCLWLCNMSLVMQSNSTHCTWTCLTWMTSWTNTRKQENWNWKGLDLKMHCKTSNDMVTEQTGGCPATWPFSRWTSTALCERLP